LKELVAPGGPVFEVPVFQNLLNLSPNATNKLKMEVSIEKKAQKWSASGCMDNNQPEVFLLVKWNTYQMPDLVNSDSCEIW